MCCDFLALRSQLEETLHGMGAAEAEELARAVLGGELHNTLGTRMHE